MSAEPEIVCRKSDWLDDWYVIEKDLKPSEHVREIRQGNEPNCMYLYDSARLSDADVEGRLGEMKAIAKAIRAADACFGFERCAVDATGEEVYLWSPRNSVDDGEPITHDQAARLAARIEAIGEGGA